MSIPATGLPPLAARLAEKLGARRAGGSGGVRLRQSGTLRGLGKAKWMRFSARQWIACDKTAFRWRARVGPLGVVHVEDALIDGSPVGTVKALGVMTLARVEPSPDLLKGELQRYLAELMWIPDAILSNTALEWEAIGDDTLVVKARIDGIEGAVTIHLGADGLPARTHALRPSHEDGGYMVRGWHGVYADYRPIGGRLIPHSARVAWDYDSKRFEVWRGTLENWRAELD